MYYMERGVWKENGCVNITNTTRSCFMRPDIVGSNLEESPFVSIPQAFWWVFATTTTVGYGDMLSFPRSNSFSFTLIDPLKK